MRRCASCDHAIEDAAIGVRDTCPSCSAYLHACRHCDFHEPAMSRGCREPQADLVADKEAGNFCDFFRWDPSRARSANAASADARAKLDALFRGKR